MITVLIFLGFSTDTHLEILRSIKRMYNKTVRSYITYATEFAWKSKMREGFCDAFSTQHSVQHRLEQREQAI